MQILLCQGPRRARAVSQLPVHVASRPNAWPRAHGRTRSPKRENDDAGPIGSHSSNTKNESESSSDNGKVSVVRIVFSE